MLKNIGNLNTSVGNVKPRTMRKYEVKFSAYKWVLFRNMIIRRKIVIQAGNGYKAKKKAEREYKIWGFITPSWVSVDYVREISQ